VMLAMLKLMQWGLCLGVVVIFGTTGGRKLRGNSLAEGLPRIWLLNRCVWVDVKQLLITQEQITQQHCI